jgi:tRNA threonylcarbamoyl adenosine modification protein (Sua5/YciO/YrdC/YwlC family)
VHLFSKVSKFRFESEVGVANLFDCSVDTDLLTGMRLAKIAIARSQLVVLPTDTVYGIAADAFSPDAVEALLAAKGRGPQSPPPVLIANHDALSALATDIHPVAMELAEAFWPGALTMIFRAQPSLAWNLGETRGTVALRIPDHKIAQALLAETGPLAVSSANLTGQPAATTAAAAQDYLGKSVEVYLDAGPSPRGESSTILDLTGLNQSLGGKIRVVRAGALSIDQIRGVVGDLLEVSMPNDTHAPREMR